MSDQIMRPSLALTDGTQVGRPDGRARDRLVLDAIYERNGVLDAVYGYDPEPADLGRCRWFARCENPATHLESHPVLGEVPCCDRCAAIGRE